MSHVGTTLSHRRTERPRRRSVVRVTLLVVLAVVAQACGSSGSVPGPAGAEENAVTSTDWKFTMLNMDNTPIEQFTDSTGTTATRLVVNKSYRVTARVPGEFVTSEFNIFLETKLMGSDKWRLQYLVRPNAMGVVNFTYREDASVPRDYRLSALNLSDSGDDYSPRHPFTYVASSNVVRAAGVVEFKITVTNNTSNDLVVKIPEVYDSKNKKWLYFKFDLDRGFKRTLTYVNPNGGVAFSILLNKQNCFRSCTDYVMDWTWRPSANWQACVQRALPVFSSAAFTINLTDQLGTKDENKGKNHAVFDKVGWKAGTISGPLNGPGTDDTLCTFTMRTNTGEWLKNHPKKGVAIIADLVVVAIAAVIVAVYAAIPLGIYPVIEAEFDEDAIINRKVWEKFVRAAKAEEAAEEAAEVAEEEYESGLSLSDESGQVIDSVEVGGSEDLPA